MTTTIERQIPRADRTKDGHYVVHQVHLKSRNRNGLSCCGADRGLNHGKEVILTERFQDVTCGRCLRSKEFRL